AVKTWKAGTDPEFATKMHRILDLYDHRPADGRVVCVDEFGPLNLQPRAGRGWFPRRKPNPDADNLGFKLAGALRDFGEQDRAHYLTELLDYRS
ncbi:hypothetical protein AB0F74_30680, partial [Nocardia salmonicida]